jgi:hypothetical protein
MHVFIFFFLSFVFFFNVTGGSMCQTPHYFLLTSRDLDCRISLEPHGSIFFMIQPSLLASLKEPPDKVLTIPAMAMWCPWNASHLLPSAYNGGI